MIEKFLFTSFVAATISTSISVYALQFDKPISTQVDITHHKHLYATYATSKKEVFVMNIKFTNTQNALLLNSNPHHYSERKLAASTLPPSIDLGMNNVPVLDQGHHGTCATFAVTAGIDAIIGKGDYVSQLCQLELAESFENVSYLPSGWYGSLGTAVFDQIQRFGIVSKSTQQTRGCAGVTDYPTTDQFSSGSPMSVYEFKSSSEDMNNIFHIITYTDAYNRFDQNFANKEHAAQTLQKTKQALVNNHRVIFGALLVLSPFCSAGACATHNEKNDTWALTDEITNPPFQLGGHEMVIYGYDDNAFATDAAGNTQTGLLILRNSWGAEVGDKGNYYMTYDYFIKFLLEAHEVSPWTLPLT